MTFNLAWAYTQLLSRLCIERNMYPKYILDSFSEFEDNIEMSVCLFSCYFAPS